MIQDGLMENKVIMLTIETLERLQSFKGHDGALDLYLFYYKMAKKQQTNQVYSTNNYVADGLLWSIDKVIKVKKTLIDMGLIEMIKELDPVTKQIKGHYVKVNYIFSSHNSKNQSMGEPEYGKDHGMDKNGTNALSNVNINALSNEDINACADKRSNSEAADEGQANDSSKTKPISKTNDLYKDVIDYLNDKAKTKYKSNTSATQRFIRARQNEGFTLQDFCAVIDVKCSQWISDSKMSAYLRPETLFGTKFESYLNENSVKQSLPNATTPNAKSDYDANGYRVKSF